MAKFKKESLEAMFGAEEQQLMDGMKEATAEGRKARKTYSPEEALEMMQEMQTTGRKGVKLPRINLAFSPDNYLFIKTMSQVRGESLTAFVNHVLDLYREEHADIYEKAKEFRASI